MAQLLINLSTSILYYMTFINKEYFYLNQLVNKHKNRMWSESQPCVGVKQRLFDDKILVWCAISVIGFMVVTLKWALIEKITQIYLKLFLAKILRTRIYQNTNFNKMERLLLQLFNFKFEKKLIDKDCWPSRSPNLNPWFYLWGYFKALYKLRH